MITTLILTKVMDYIFFIALVWVAFFIYGVMKRVSTGSPVELKVLFIITWSVFLIIFLTSITDWSNMLLVPILLLIGTIIWDIADIIKYKKKKLAEK